MTSKEISEGNKLIAEFLGFPTKEHWWHHPNPQFRLGNINSSLNASTCKFHDDWNWLMEVVEKIDGELRYRFTISTTFVRVHTCKNGHDDWDDYNCEVFDGKLNCTYHAVIEFIKWYNEKK